MNNNRIRRLINEYLDGEIGLADKAQLEQIMAENPRVRDEYDRLRRMGSLLGLMPEVRVHPYKFRARLNDAMSTTENRAYFTPQRAFSAAMLVVLVVFVVTFGLFAYQQQIISGSSFIIGPAEDSQPVAAAPGAQLVVDTGVNADQFFSRLALQHRIGMLNGRLFDTVVAQTRVYEGATCIDGAPLAPLRFAVDLPREISLTISPDQLSELASVAEELSGYPARVVFPGGDSAVATDQLTRQLAGQTSLIVQLRFR